MVPNYINANISLRSFESCVVSNGSKTPVAKNHGNPRVVLEPGCFVLLIIKRTGFIQSSYFHFPKPNSLKSWEISSFGYGVTSDFAEDFPRCGSYRLGVDLPALSHFPSLADGLVGFFQGFFQSRKMWRALDR